VGGVVDGGSGGGLLLDTCVGGDILLVGGHQLSTSQPISGGGALVAMTQRRNYDDPLGSAAQTAGASGGGSNGGGGTMSKTAERALRERERGVVNASFQATIGSGGISLNDGRQLSDARPISSGGGGSIVAARPQDPDTDDSKVLSGRFGLDFGFGTSSKRHASFEVAVGRDHSDDHAFHVGRENAGVGSGGRIAGRDAHDDYDDDDDDDNADDGAAFFADLVGINRADRNGVASARGTVCAVDVPWQEGSRKRHAHPGMDREDVEEEEMEDDEDNEEIENDCRRVRHVEGVVFWCERCRCEVQVRGVTVSTAGRDGDADDANDGDGGSDDASPAPTAASTATAAATADWIVTADFSSVIQSETDPDATVQSEATSAALIQAEAEHDDWHIARDLQEEADNEARALVLTHARLVPATRSQGQSRGGGRKHTKGTTTTKAKAKAKVARGGGGVKSGGSVSSGGAGHGRLGVKPPPGPGTLDSFFSSKR
jgi:hypothetical protein